jgi:hypothetical protein
VRRRTSLHTHETASAAALTRACSPDGEAERDMLTRDLVTGKHLENQAWLEVLQTIDDPYAVDEVRRAGPAHAVSQQSHPR